VMATDWWTTKQGENARDVAAKIQPQIDRDTVPSESEKERAFADSQEKNAWQADGFIDRVILVLLVAAIVNALVAAWARAADRSIGPPSPSGLASVVGLVCCVLLVYRILQPPGLNEAAVVKAGAPLGLLCVGLLAFGARVAARGEAGRRGAAASKPSPPPEEPARTAA
jgi:hypothetical protein